MLEGRFGKVTTSAATNGKVRRHNFFIFFAALQCTPLAHTHLSTPYHNHILFVFGFLPLLSSPLRSLFRIFLLSLFLCHFSSKQRETNKKRRTHTHSRTAPTCSDMSSTATTAATVAQFTPFTFSNGIQVDDWDYHREGFDWGTRKIKCSNALGSIQAELEKLWLTLPVTNLQGIPRSCIKFFHLSGDLNNPSTFPITVEIAY